MDYLRRFLQKIRVLPSDEELGNRAAVYPTDRRATVATEQDEYHIEVSDKLQEFRLLIGITTHGSYKAPRGFDPNQRAIVTTSGRPAPNVGIYATVVDNEIRQKKQYVLFSRGINACLGVQIVVAATLTALGAGNGGRAAVTVFGGINTVIAGLLTYLKGSGLPGRLQYFQHEWTKLREYIEQKERDLSLPNDIDVAEEVRYIRWMFENVREDIEANRPDRFVGTGPSQRNHLTSGQPDRGGSSVNALTRTNTGVQLQHAGTGLMDGLSQLKAKVSDLNKDFGSATTSEVHHFQSTMNDDFGRLKSSLRQRLSEIESLERDVEAQSRRAIENKEAELSRKAGEKVYEAGGELGHLEKEIESYGRQTANEIQHEVEDNATDAAADALGRIQATLELRDPFKEEKRGL